MGEVLCYPPRSIVRRRFAPKTRSGCRTCKIRRVKCDEAKPSCKRCTSTGRKCDGYESNSPTDSAASLSPPEVPQVALLTDVASDALEKRIFDFFRAKTVPGLSGCFQDITWDRTVLQVANSEPAVRYAVNALGALHEEITLRRKSRQDCLSQAIDCRTSFPIKQYSKAIRELHKVIESNSAPLEVVLLCSMIFMHLECIQESFLPALVHLENAIRLVTTKAATGQETVDDGIVQALRRMDVQGSMYLGTRIPGLHYYGLDAELPPHFRSLAQARDVVAASTCRLFHFLRTEADEHKYIYPGNVALETYAKAQSFEQESLELDLLLVAFARTTKKHLTVREQHGVDMLRSRAKMNRILAACAVYAEMSTFDRFQDEIKDILALCQSKLYGEDLDECLFSASLDEGLVTPLSFVANTCRDSKTRRRAITLIDELARREGIWYVEVMARISEAVAIYEEEVTEKEYPTCEDIPEWRRVHGSGLSGWDVSSPRPTAKVHLRIRPNGMDGEWCDVQVQTRFRATINQSNLAEFNNNSVPALTVIYPPHDAMDSLDSFQSAFKPKLHTEPFMSTLPFNLAEPR